jgi:hypothetical protein
MGEFTEIIFLSLIPLLLRSVPWTGVTPSMEVSVLSIYAALVFILLPISLLPPEKIRMIATLSIVPLIPTLISPFELLTGIICAGVSLLIYYVDKGSPEIHQRLYEIDYIMDENRTKTICFVVFILTLCLAGDVLWSVFRNRSFQSMWLPLTWFLIAWIIIFVNKQGEE